MEFENVPVGLLGSVTDTMETWGKQDGGAAYTLTIERYYPHRTTGRYSQNHRLWGFCRQIALATGNDTVTVHEWVKAECAENRGYPMRTFQGRTVPMSEREANTVECSILIERVQQLAAEMGIMLRESEGT